MPRRAPNRDKGEPDIIDGLKSAGCTVQQLDARDVPDLLVGLRGVNVLMEVKRPLGKRGGTSADGQHLSGGQARWHRKWNGQVCVVRSLEEALIVVGLRSLPPTKHHGRRRSLR